MLQLIYSPYYDGNYFAGNPEKQKCTLGTKYVGDLALLNELELRAGLSRGDVSPMKRAIEYCNAIQQVLDSNPGNEPFYQKSFQNDPLGVARQLLSWRDALTMAGWSKQTKLPNTLSDDGKKRMSDLQAIENHFTTVGVGERWQELLQVAQGRPILPQGTTITVELKWDLLHPVIKKVFEAINKQIPDTVKESDAVKSLDDNVLDASKFTLYEFPEQNDAYQWAALQNFENAVFVNEDNFTFNQVLKSVGKPMVGASIQGSVPEMSQLLKLGISLFRSPVNYDNLIEYLSIFRHPIDRDTRRKLCKHLQAAGGFGEHQGNAFPTIDPSYNDVWGMWDKCKIGSNGAGVGVKEVKTYCEALLKWTETAITNATAEKVMNPYVGTQICSQISILQEQIRSLQVFLKGKTGNITNDELDKIVVSICQGDAVTTDQARLGSYDMLKDIKGLASEMGKVVWMDCVGKPRPRYAYSFLNPKDIQKLQQNGLDIPNPQLEMLASDFAEKLAVSRAKLIIALMPKRKDGERTEENLLITELKTLNTGLAISSPSLPVGDTVTLVDADSQKAEHKVDKSLFANITTPNPAPAKDTTKSSASKFTPKPVGYQRDYESFSSLDMLINQPFDYVLNYLYNMKDEELDSNLSTIEGTVAHAVISQMVEESKDAATKVADTNVFLSFCKDNGKLETRLDSAINDFGTILLQPENAMECAIFKRIFLNKSVPALVKIIDDNDLEVVDSEWDLTEDLKDDSDKVAFKYNAKIDFVLKKKNEEKYYIFDFKWTGNPKKRSDELENRKELQLALYQKILETIGHTVVMRGYYLLKQATLLTAYTGFNPSDEIEIIEQKSSADIFEQAVESYCERIANLQAGYIEEGEEMSGKVFAVTKFIGKYLQLCQTKGIVPDSYFLNNDVTMKYTKTKSLASMNTAKKKTTYGKNQVLKGKIK